MASVGRRLRRGDPRRIQGAVAVYTKGWPKEAQEDFEALVSLAEKGIGAEALVKVLEDNLNSIDTERMALSPYARGALGGMIAAFKDLVRGGEAGPYYKDFDANEAMKRRQRANEVARLAEWETTFPGAEASEVLAILDEERWQYKALLTAAGEFLDNLRRSQIGVQTVTAGKVQSRLEKNLRAQVTAGRKSGPQQAEEIEATL